MNVQENLTTVQKLIDTVIAFFVNYSFQVIGALIILALGIFVANSLSGALQKVLEKNNVDITLSKFLSSALRLTVIGFAVLIALGKFGISTSPLIAALSAAVFGASFALKGPLSNYGAGISIILSRPFTVGNTITVQGVSGVVTEVKLACTRLVNEDGVVITIPNSQVVGQVMYNSKMNSVVEGVVGIGYECDPDVATASISAVLQAHPEVSKTPAPQIGIQSFGDSSMNMGYRYWVPTAKYFQTLYDVNHKIYRVFQQKKITIPYPQREVRVISQQTIGGSGV